MLKTQGNGTWLTWKLREPFEKEEEAKRKELEAKKKDENMKSQETLVLAASLEQLQNSQTVADDSVKEGNEQLQQLLTQKNCVKKDLQRAQSKIEMGQKRRAEPEEDQKVLKKKLKEIHEK